MTRRNELAIEAAAHAWTARWSSRMPTALAVAIPDAATRAHAAGASESAIANAAAHLPSFADAYAKAVRAVRGVNPPPDETIPVALDAFVAAATGTPVEDLARSLAAGATHDPAQGWRNPSAADAIALVTRVLGGSIISSAA